MSTQRTARNRILAALVVLLVIPVGLLARSLRAGADAATLPGFLATYMGDALWPIMFFFLGRVVFPLANRWPLAAFTLGLTLTLEFGQLWQPAWLQWLREQPVIGFILGNSFVWSDVVCLVVGSVVAVIVDAVLSGFVREAGTNGKSGDVCESAADRTIAIGPKRG